MQDSIQVRYRDRNNFMQTTEGSITQTAKQLEDQRKKQKELKDAQQRLKQLEQLEEYRERKMLKEMEKLEAERAKEEQAIRDAIQKEQKYSTYLEK